MFCNALTIVFCILTPPPVEQNGTKAMPDKSWTADTPSRIALDISTIVHSERMYHGSVYGLHVDVIYGVSPAAVHSAIYAYVYTRLRAGLPIGPSDLEWLNPATEAFLAATKRTSPFELCALEMTSRSPVATLATVKAAESALSVLFS